MQKYQLKHENNAYASLNLHISPTIYRCIMINKEWNLRDINLGPHAYNTNMLMVEVHWYKGSGGKNYELTLNHPQTTRLPCSILPIIQKWCVIIRRHRSTPKVRIYILQYSTNLQYITQFSHL